MPRIVFAFLLAFLTSCAEPPPIAALGSGAGLANEAAVPLQADLAASLLPPVVAVREAVEAIAPAAPAPISLSADAELTACATALIVRWEVSGEATYTRRYQGVIWPGGASGPTWGIGYDGGHQTRSRIAADWAAHAAVGRLQTTAGVTGRRAHDLVAGGEWGGVVTPYRQAADVFGAASLPTYRATARRAFGDSLSAAPIGVQCAILSLIYNRGGAMSGSRRTEMRIIRDTCLPADRSCTARALASMCRLWEGTPNGAGLCARRKDEARTALR